MQNNLASIIVKKEGVSDDFYKILELYKPNGSWVNEGDLVLCFETSKTAIDLESPANGYIFFDTNEDEEVAIGQTIAVISEEKSFSYQDWFKFVNEPKKEKEETKNTSIKISKPAQRLIDQSNIDISVFGNSKMITKEDVEIYLKNIKTQELPSDLTINQNSVLIFGGGGHAKMCIDILKQTQSHSIVGILDDNISAQTEVLQIPVLGNKNILEKLIKKGLQHVVLGVGGVLNKGLRKKIFNSLKNEGLSIPTIIHPTASLEPSVIIGEGNQIMQGAIIGSDVRIGDNCIINSGSIISHDTVIGNNVHIAPGAIIGGGVTIKDDAVIGMGCTIFLGLTIGKGVIIQNGLNVFKNTQDNK